MQQHSRIISLMGTSSHVSQQESLQQQTYLSKAVFQARSLEAPASVQLAFKAVLSSLGATRYSPGDRRCCPEGCWHCLVKHVYIATGAAGSCPDARVKALGGARPRPHKGEARLVWGVLKAPKEVLTSLWRSLKAIERVLNSLEQTLYVMRIVKVLTPCNLFIAVAVTWIVELTAAEAVEFRMSTALISITADLCRATATVLRDGPALSRLVNSAGKL